MIVRKILGANLTLRAICPSLREGLLKVRGWGEGVWTPSLDGFTLCKKPLKGWCNPRRTRFVERKKSQKKQQPCDDHQHVVKHPRTRIHLWNSPKHRTTYAPTRRSEYIMSCCIQNEYRSVTRVLDKVKKSIFLNKGIRVEENYSMFWVFCYWEFYQPFFNLAKA